MPTFGKPYQPEPNRDLRTSLTIIRAHSEHLLTAYNSLTEKELLTLLKAIHTQTTLLEHLLDELINLPQTDKE